MFSILSPYCWRWYRSLSLCWRWIKIMTEKSVCIAVVVSGVKKNIIVIMRKLKLSFLHNYPSCSLIHILVNMYGRKAGWMWGEWWSVLVFSSSSSMNTNNFQFFILRRTLAEPSMQWHNIYLYVHTNVWEAENFPLFPFSFSPPTIVYVRDARNGNRFDVALKLFFSLVSTLRSTAGRIQFTKRAHREWLMIVLQIYSLELYNWYHHCLSFQNI